MKKKRLNFHSRRIPCLKQMCRVMKLTAFLLFVMFFQVSAGVFSQNNGRFSLRVEQESINDILNLIEEQSNYTFMYNRNNIDVERKANINCESKKIEEILDMLFRGTGVKYRSFNNNYVLYTEGEEFSGQTQQNMKVSGIVSDSSGAPLPGVTVVIKGTTQGTISDFEGNYSITNVPRNATLTFSFVGMKTQEILVSGKSFISVTMAEDAIGIEEVVAVGYGTVRKSDLTGSVAKVNVSNSIERSVTSVEQMLQGQVSGVQITQNTGAPGAGITFSVRGATSISGSNQPLIIIDGYPVNTDDNSVKVNTNSGYGAVEQPTDNALANLNPGEIESVEILKDASAAAIYGSRASNGVVLITTKRGKAG